jgi:hypothetical protein
MTTLCRTPDCGCPAEKGHYCAMCAEFTPICPICGAVYGEHRMTCTVADGYDDCREGPWSTREEAEAFAKAEVGMPWQVEGAGGQWYVMVKDED